MNRPAKFRSSALLAACLVAVAACRDMVESPSNPSRIVVIDGDMQYGPAGALLPVPIRFQVLDAGGHPVAAVGLQVNVVTGSGSVSQGRPTTNDQGMAEVVWSLGSVPGEQRIEARIGTVLVVQASAQACATSGCTNPPNRIRLLPLVTYEGSGQVVHPDVAIGAGNLAGFWLAITPYPNGNSSFENPSIFSSSEGLGWAVPKGVVNPVESPSAGSYLSDPDIVFDPAIQQLWLFSRQVISGLNTVLLARSPDGIHWQAPTALFSAPSHAIISPSVVRSAPSAPWTMWSVNSGPQGCTAQHTTVERRTSSNGLQWSVPTATDLVQPGKIIWHIEVQWLPARSEYWAVYNTDAPGGTCVTEDLYLARSSDGLHWQTYPSPIVSRGAVDEFADVVYRSTFMTTPAAGTVMFWLSGAKYDSRTGYIWRAATLVRRIDDLLAAVQLPFSALRTPARRNLPPPEPDVGGAPGS